MTMDAITSETLLLYVILSILERSHVHQHKIHLALVLRIRCQLFQLFGRRPARSEVLVEVNDGWQW